MGRKEIPACRCQDWPVTESSVEHRKTRDSCSRLACVASGGFRGEFRPPEREREREMFVHWIDSATLTDGQVTGCRRRYGCRRRDARGRGGRARGHMHKLMVCASLILVADSGTPKSEATQGPFFAER